MTLPSLQPDVPIVDALGRPTQAFMMFWEQVSRGLTISSGAAMPTPSAITIRQDYTGALLAGQLPYTFNFQRLLNGVDMSARSRWFLSTVSGQITASIDQGGLCTIAAISSNATLQAKSVRDGLTLTAQAVITLSQGNPPATGSSGNATSTCTTFNSVSSTSYSAPADITPLTVTVGSSGTVNLSAPLSVTTAKTAAGTYPVWSKWQWYNGTAWVDVASEAQSSPSCEVDSSTQDTVPPRTIYSLTPGTLSANASQTGLTNGSTAKFQLLVRNDTTTGTRTMNLSGTASAVPA